MSCQTAPGHYVLLEFGIPFGYKIGSANDKLGACAPLMV
ncbi:unnamed protein product, partial [Staurois parvus]